jgi:hypothetical protein
MMVGRTSNGTEGIADAGNTDASAGDGSAASGHGGASSQDATLRDRAGAATLLWGAVWRTLLGVTGHGAGWGAAYGAGLMLYGALTSGNIAGLGWTLPGLLFGGLVGAIAGAVLGAIHAVFVSVPACWRARRRQDVDALVANAALAAHLVNGFLMVVALPLIAVSGGVTGGVALVLALPLVPAWISSVRVDRGVAAWCADHTPLAPRVRPARDDEALPPLRWNA